MAGGTPLMPAITSLVDLEVALGRDLAPLVAMEERGDHIIQRQRKYLDRQTFMALFDRVRELGGRYLSYQEGFEVPISKSGDGHDAQPPSPEPMGLEAALGLTGREWQLLKVATGEAGYIINPRQPPLDQDLESRLLDRVNELGGRWTPEGYLIPRPLAPEKGVDQPPSTPESEGFDELAERLIAGKILYGDLGRVRPNGYNPNEMSEEEFNALVENMREEGPQGTDPLLVRPLPGSGLEIIDGEHRWKAARILGWRKIRYEVRDVDEDRAKEINYAKNRLRGRINPFKEADLFYSAWNKLGTQEAVAKKFRVSRTYVADALSLLKIFDKARKIVARATSRRSLRILATIDDPADQEKLAEKIRDGCTVREAQGFANSLKVEASSRSPQAPSEKPGIGAAQPPGEEPSTPPWGDTAMPAEIPEQPGPDVVKIPLKEEKAEERRKAKPWWAPAERFVPSNVLDAVARYATLGSDERRLRFLKTVIEVAWEFVEGHNGAEGVLLEAERRAGR